QGRSGGGAGTQRLTELAFVATRPQFRFRLLGDQLRIAGQRLAFAVARTASLRLRGACAHGGGLRDDLGRRGGGTGAGWRRRRGDRRGCRGLGVARLSREHGDLVRLLRLGRQRARGGLRRRRARRLRLGVAGHIRATEQQFLQGNLIGLGQRRLVRRRQGVAEFGKDLLIGRGGRLAGQDRDRRGRRRAI